MLRRQLIRWKSTSSSRQPLSIDKLTSPRPSPIPLGDSKQQREMEELIKQQKLAVEQDPEGKHEDAERERSKPFEGDKNPQTGEIGGPRGPEPTRYGDWQTKGRVYDF